MKIENNDFINPIIEYMCVNNKVLFQFTIIQLLESARALRAPQNLTLSDTTKNRKAMTAKEVFEVLCKHLHIL